MANKTAPRLLGLGIVLVIAILAVGAASAGWLPVRTLFARSSAHQIDFSTSHPSCASSCYEGSLPQLALGIAHQASLRAVSGGAL